MELLAKISFGLYALIIVGGGVIAVGSKSLVRALLGLILTLFGVAGIYLLMAAPFMAFLQILIYLGAVVVLIFLAIMLARAPAGAEECGKRPKRQLVLTLLTGLVPGCVLGWTIWQSSPSGRLVPTEVNVTTLGRAFLGPYVLAFELISVVLFVAMAGAVLVGWERRVGK